MTFHEKLGTRAEKVERMVALVDDLGAVGGDPSKATRSALLAKADLVTGMVGEFPELQGLMGGYYASAQGEDPAVAQAIAGHYKPLGPNDDCPSAPLAVREIGRASCRERVCQYVEILVVAVPLKKKKQKT